MIIANPIYDVVFKYLMDDMEIARDILSVITMQKIQSLQFSPQETVVRDMGANESQVFRLDFKAVIQTPTGDSKVVLIELQKAKLALDIMRFPRYLGKAYSSEEAIIQPDQSIKMEVAEIISIYLLGDTLAEHPDESIMHIEHQLHGLSSENTFKKLDIKTPFVRLLTHKCMIIQIPKLPPESDHEMLEVLSIFSQHDVLKTDKHKKDYRGNSQNPIKQKIVKRLQLAAADANLQKYLEEE
jgi:hypothetical protein